MSYDGWFRYNDKELINLGRTAALAEDMGLDTVWTSSDSVSWIGSSLAETGYNDVTTAPWYDSAYPASADFAGFVPLSVSGLDDSTLSSTPVEYLTDGGHSGRGRHSTLALVFSVALVGVSEDAVEFGLRWLKRRLLDVGASRFCSGADLDYFRSVEGAVAHRRDVKITRGVSVTKRRVSDCSATTLVTFTMTAADPFEYSEPVPSVTSMDTLGATGPAVLSFGSTVLVNQSCPVYDYSPIYDPLHPALVPSPTAPDFYPSSWQIRDGMTFDRFYSRVSMPNPSDLSAVPTIKVSSAAGARTVRVSLWEQGTAPSTQCGALLSYVVTYLPPGMNLYIDGEQKAIYVWDGASPSVRRADSLVYNGEAYPVDWDSISGQDEVLLTLDIFSDSGGLTGGDVIVSLDLTQKSD